MPFGRTCSLEIAPTVGLRRQRPADYAVEAAAVVLGHQSARPGGDVKESRETEVLLALLHLPGAKWSVIARETREAGSAIEVAQREGLLGGLFEDPTWQVAENSAAATLRLLKSADADLITILDENYPARLQVMRQPPPILTGMGEWDVRDADGVAVIGSRHASRTALDAAYTISAQLAEAGLVVTSGLAAGVDTAAHQGALAAGGRTVALLGTGITQYYPASNHALQDQIATQGLLISQFLPETAPSRLTFPLRNHLHAAWTKATLVIEASEQGGARMQARIALEQGRQLLLHERALAEAWAREYADAGSAQVITSSVEVVESLGHR